MLPKPSSIALIVANLVPLAGVLVLDWKVFDILILYWAENVVIGVINVMRMIASKGGRVLPQGVEEQVSAALTQSQKLTVSRITGGIKFFLIPFFIVHYGMFCFGHLSFIQGMFGDDEMNGLSSIVPASGTWTDSLWLAIAAIFVSHLISFFMNFIGAKEYERATVNQLMGRPYGRIITLHIAIVLGAGLITFLGDPVYMLVVLIAVKIAIDLRLHGAERRKFSFESASLA